MQLCANLTKYEDLLHFKSECTKKKCLDIFEKCFQSYLYSTCKLFTLLFNFWTGPHSKATDNRWSEATKRIIIAPCSNQRNIWLVSELILLRNKYVPYTKKRCTSELPSQQNPKRPTQKLRTIIVLSRDLGGPKDKSQILWSFSH